MTFYCGSGSEVVEKPKTVMITSFSVRNQKSLVYCKCKVSCIGCRSTEKVALNLHNNNNTLKTAVVGIERCAILHSLQSATSLSVNELPVIGSLCLCKDFWDRHGANIPSC